MSRRQFFTVNEALSVALGEVDFEFVGGGDLDRDLSDRVRDLDSGGLDSDL